MNKKKLNGIEIQQLNGVSIYVDKVHGENKMTLKAINEMKSRAIGYHKDMLTLASVVRILNNQRVTDVTIQEAFNAICYGKSSGSMNLLRLYSGEICRDTLDETGIIYGTPITHNERFLYKPSTGPTPDEIAMDILKLLNTL